MNEYEQPQPSYPDAPRWLAPVLFGALCVLALASFVVGREEPTDE